MTNPPHPPKKKNKKKYGLMILIGFYASSFMKFGYFRRNSFFGQNEIILRGKKHIALLQTFNWEKSSFFNALVHVFAQIYANTWQGGHICPSLGQIGLNTQGRVPEKNVFFRTLPEGEEACGRIFRPFFTNCILGQ